MIYEAYTKKKTACPTQPNVDDDDDDDENDVADGKYAWADMKDIMSENNFISYWWKQIYIYICVCAVRVCWWFRMHKHAFIAATRLPMTEIWTFDLTQKKKKKNDFCQHQPGKNSFAWLSNTRTFTMGTSFGMFAKSVANCHG